jgi:hypothetical protein
MQVIEILSGTDLQAIKPGAVELAISVGAFAAVAKFITDSQKRGVGGKLGVLVYRVRESESGGVYIVHNETLIVVGILVGMVACLLPIIYAIVHRLDLGRMN